MNSLVKQDNRLRWNSSQRPFFERYFVKLVSKDSDWSFWCCYSLLVPKQSTIPGHAALSGIFTHKNGETNLSIDVSQKFLLTEVDLFHAERFFDLGASYLSLDGCCGVLADSDHQLTWDFKFEDPTYSAALWHYPILYRFGLPATKMIAPRTSTLISGYLTVDHHTFKLDGAKAYQSHVWGSRYFSSWVWMQCNQFHEDASAHFEGLCTPIRSKNRFPQINLFSFYVDGEWFEANAVQHWFGNKASGNNWVWNFRASANGYLFEGEMIRTPEEVIGIEYESPRGGHRYSQQSQLTAMKITISKRQSGQWKFYKELTSNAAAFELVESVSDTGKVYVL